MPMEMGAIPVTIVALIHYLQTEWLVTTIPLCSLGSQTLQVKISDKAHWEWAADDAWDFNSTSGRNVSEWGLESSERSFTHCLQPQLE